MNQGVGVNSCFSKKDSLKIVSNSIIGILLLLTCITAWGDQFDTLSYSASAGVTYDDNLFKLPSGVDPQLAIGQPIKSDVIQTESLGINLDKKYANQEIVFRGSTTNNKYNTFSNLNYTNTVYSAAWNGNLASRLSVGVSDSRTQSLNTFADIHVYTRNLTTVDTTRLNADCWIQSNWHLTFGATGSKTTSSQSVINNQSYTSKVAEWGVKYTPANGSTIALVSRVIQNESINSPLNYYLLVDTQSTDTQKELDVNWLLSGKSVLSGNLISINHQNPTFYQRNFSATAGGLNYFYSISDKTSLNISFNRAISSWYDFSSSYSMIDTFSIAPSWQISAKTIMHIAASRSKANYFGPIVPNATPRFDEIQSQTLGLDWTPQRSVTLSTSFQSSLRYSNFTSYEYDDRSASLSVQITF
jgi:exopolysaccharide biosynthesis operon protein EpsL